MAIVDRELATLICQGFNVGPAATNYKEIMEGGPAFYTYLMKWSESLSPKQNEAMRQDASVTKKVLAHDILIKAPVFPPLGQKISSTFKRDAKSDWLPSPGKTGEIKDFVLSHPGYAAGAALFVGLLVMKGR
jgi:hypothetical protein